MNKYTRTKNSDFFILDNYLTVASIQVFPSTFHLLIDYQTMWQHITMATKDIKCYINEIVVYK